MARFLVSCWVGTAALNTAAFCHLRKSVFFQFSETAGSWFSCYFFGCSFALGWFLIHPDQKGGSLHSR